MGNNQWTENFNELEFTVSQGFPELVSDIPDHLLPSMQAVAVELLQPIRDRVGRGLRILSGYRSPALNRAVGGSRTSQHAVAEAADFTTSAIREVMYEIIDMLDEGLLPTAGQIIYYPHKSFIHIALSSQRYSKPTICVNWPAENLHYAICFPSREAFDEMVPPHLDPSNE